MMWVNLENIRLSESSQSQKTPSHINVQNRQIIETDGRIVVAKDGGRGVGEDS